MQLSLPAQDERKEQENVEFLIGMMNGDLDPAVARRVLRKHAGNVQKTADAILEGDRGEELVPTVTYTEPQSTANIPQALPNDPSNPTVIDLSAEDDDYTRAVQMSMETPRSEPTFGPSERAPHPEWQMVTSNAPTNPDPTHDDSLSQAIQASLNDFSASDGSDLFPFEETVREGGRPVALRPELPGIAYSALVLQSLFFVPQVRQYVSQLPLPEINEDTPRDSPQRALWNLVEIFVNMDLAQLSAIVDKDYLLSLEPKPYTSVAESVGDLSSDFLKRIGDLIEERIHLEDPTTRLFNFFHGTAEFRNNIPLKVKRNPGDGCVVVVDSSEDSVPNNLISRLATHLSRYHDDGSSHDVIFEPSIMVAFHLKLSRPQSTSGSSTGKHSPGGFVYPKTIYLDQFLIQNLDLANQKRDQERRMIEEVNRLTLRKNTLTLYNNRDALKDMRATLHYFEKIADNHNDAERIENISTITRKLRSTIASITEEVNAIGHRIEQLQSEITHLFDCPELQNHRYDLRAVLIHTGLPGRKQIYSYVQDTNGLWWKTVDYTVTEVSEETVLTDPTGLHLNAGPYLLIYSRYLPEDQIKAPVVWPRMFADVVKQHNKTLLTSLPREMAAKARSPDNSIPFDEDAMTWTADRPKE
ncbi:hypothetical protein BD779DRAFT_1522582 [Infundibulicybe gibba]|nr:hypothetical protein BD779DRAFT_1522582 [Infundibulicybe gibba]